MHSLNRISIGGPAAFNSVPLPMGAGSEGILTGVFSGLLMAYCASIRPSRDNNGLEELNSKRISEVHLVKQDERQTFKYELFSTDFTNKGE